MDYNAYREYQVWQIEQLLMGKAIEQMVMAYHYAKMNGLSPLPNVGPRTCQSPDDHNPPVQKTQECENSAV